MKPEAYPIRDKRGLPCGHWSPSTSTVFLPRDIASLDSHNVIANKTIKLDFDLEVFMYDLTGHSGCYWAGVGLKDAKHIACVVADKVKTKQREREFIKVPREVMERVMEVYMKNTDIQSAYQMSDADYDIIEEILKDEIP